MPANPNWARYIFASVAKHLKDVAEDANVAVLVDGFDERTKAFMEASPRVEIRITGPDVRPAGTEGEFYAQVQANVLISCRYDGKSRNAFDISRLCGLFQEALTTPIPIWNYGSEVGDYVEGDPSTQIHLGCLQEVSGRNNYVKVFHFGQIHEVDKLTQSAVDARLSMDLTA